MSYWGPSHVGEGYWQFRLWAPNRDSVTLEIDGALSRPMDATADGWFTATAPATGGTRYRFRLDPGLAVPDPASRLQAGGVHGWSVVVDSPHPPPRAWRGRPWAETVIYELHVGLAGGFADAIALLPGLAQLGVTAIELMPINAFSGTRNWGYDGVLPFAPAEAYGTPAQLRGLIQAAHGLGLMVFLDVVYNHFGPDGNYLAAYASDFFHADRDTPWGGAVAVDRTQVAAYFLENALMWLQDYGFDGLRFDAVHAIDNADFLDWLARHIRSAIGPDRHVHLMLENEHNDAARLGDGRYDAQWNDDFHNVLHVLLTGETEGYYEDFAQDPTARLARCLGEGFIYQGDPSPHQDGKRRGSPSGHLCPTAFIAFLQNHDQTGNRALGERLISLTSRDKLKAATALLLLMPQIPLLFMGEEVGSETPFTFFTDFHDELADVVREGRRREFATFAAFASEKARAAIPDPNAPATFEMARVALGTDSPAWRDFYAELLALRHQHIVPGLSGCVALGAEILGRGAVQAGWRLGTGQCLYLFVNLGDTPVPPPIDVDALFTLGVPGQPATVLAWMAAA